MTLPMKTLRVSLSTFLTVGKHLGWFFLGVMPLKAQVISAGDYYNVILCQNGKPHAFGANYDGQLGNGTRDKKAAPYPVSNLTAVIAVSAG
ncbi:MAG: hypothetical protein ACUVRD_09295 [Bacteroidia bacterium]